MTHELAGKRLLMAAAALSGTTLRDMLRLVMGYSKGLELSTSGLVPSAHLSLAPVTIRAGRSWTMLKYSHSLFLPTFRARVTCGKQRSEVHSCGRQLFVALTISTSYIGTQPRGGPNTSMMAASQPCIRSGSL